MVTVVLPSMDDACAERVGDGFLRSPLIRRILIIRPRGHSGSGKRQARGAWETVESDSPLSGGTVRRIIDGTETKYLLWMHGGEGAVLLPGALERLVEAAIDTGAGAVYGDRVGHPVNDYQLGSIRDDFDFGSTLLFEMASVRNCLQKYGEIPDLAYAGLYDLRLKLSMDHRPFHLAEPLSVRSSPEDPSVSGAAAHFAYVDPRNRAYQVEMERMATDHLRRLDAYLAPYFQLLPTSGESFPVEASVIIPVRNRRRTITDAVGSALTQVADFPFNILVVDNHSTDGTTEILRKLSVKYEAVRHIIPDRTDLGIGGCWNEAVHDRHCGRYVIQLDSDDLYSETTVVQRMVAALRGDEVAMVVGSYTIVDENLEEIPPGLIDHREWTDDNGRNNALRINGLGAPRAFRTSLLRRIGFPNVSYGEDYAVALRISRQYRIGRIYDSLYLCRRWAGNTDAALPVETANRYHAYKDQLRTVEIMARQMLNRERMPYAG